jgi:hypothetical protein
MGVTAATSLTRERLTKLYSGGPGKDTYVNADVGLIEVDHPDRRTTDVRSIRQLDRWSPYRRTCLVRRADAATGELWKANSRPSSIDTKHEPASNMSLTF